MTGKIIALVVLVTSLGLPLSAKRIRSFEEASPSKVAPVLRHAKLIGVFCGEDVEWETCEVFARALSVSMRDRHVGVILKHEPEVLVQSFYVPAMPFPFTDVTVRLIESDGALSMNVGRRIPFGKDGITRVYLGGQCYDPNSSNALGLRLPIWIEREGNSHFGLLRSDREKAARELAKEFRSWWDEIINPKRRN